MDNLDHMVLLAPKYPAQQISDHILLAHHSLGGSREYHVRAVLAEAEKLEAAISDLRAAVAAICETQEDAA
jgi:hypothetical protein